MLTNKTVLITRPAGREKNLRLLIEQAGGKVIHHPVIEIQPPTNTEIKHFLQLREQLHIYSMAIFISPTAVEQSLAYFPSLPEHLTIVSIGSKTTKSLEQENIRVDIEAQEHNTESLLQAEDFQIPHIQGQHLLIFRGSGGRNLLGDTLLQRGALVRYVETYKRDIPTQPPLSEQQINSLDALTVSSNEGLDNLVTLTENSSLIVDIPIVLPSKRAIKLAKKHGFNKIISAQNATDEATFTALIDYFS